jgi:CrcB protein
MIRITEWSPLFWVALGGALGSVLRFWSYGFVYRFLPDTFPYATLAVNILGSTFIGFFAALTATEGRLMAPAYLRLFVMPGICGGFTTFSTFSLETVTLARDGHAARAVANVAASVGFCLLGAWLGQWLANER